MKKIAWACVAALLAVPAIASAADSAPRTVILKTGERVTGTVVSRTEKDIVIDSTGMGTVTVTAGNIESVIGPDGKVEVYDPSTAVPDPGLFGTGILSGWTRQFELGVTGTAGTTDSTAVNAQFNATTDNESYRSTLGAWYFLTTDNTSTSRNQTRVFGTYDKKIDGGPWFVFGRAQYDNDSLQLWENRVSLFAGPGYEFIKKDNYELIGRAGLGYTHEFGGNTPSDYDDSRFEALIGIDGKWVIDSNQTFNYSCYYYPSLESLDYGRIVSTAWYQADLNKSQGIAFKAGVEHTYEFITPGDDQHNNYKYFMNLVMKL